MAEVRCPPFVGGVRANSCSFQPARYLYHPLSSRLWISTVRVRFIEAPVSAGPSLTLRMTSRAVVSLVNSSVAIPDEFTSILREECRRLRCKPPLTQGTPRVRRHAVDGSSGAGRYSARAWPVTRPTSTSSNHSLSLHSPCAPHLRITPTALHMRLCSSSSSSSSSAMSSKVYPSKWYRMRLPRSLHRVPRV